MSWDMECLNGEVKINSDQGLQLTFPDCRIISIHHSWSPEAYHWTRGPGQLGLRQTIRLEFEVMDRGCQVQKMRFWDILKLLWKRPMKGSPFDTVYTENKEEKES